MHLSQKPSTENGHVRVTVLVIAWLLVSTHPPPRGAAADQVLKSMVMLLLLVEGRMRGISLPGADEIEPVLVEFTIWRLRSSHLNGSKILSSYLM